MRRSCRRPRRSGRGRRWVPRLAMLLLLPGTEEVADEERDEGDNNGGYDNITLTEHAAQLGVDGIYLWRFPPGRSPPHINGGSRIVSTLDPCPRPHGPRRRRASRG